MPNRNTSQGKGKVKPKSTLKSSTSRSKSRCEITHNAYSCAYKKRINDANQIAKDLVAEKQQKYKKR